MLIYIRSTLFIILLFSSAASKAQSDELTVMFYNVENYFDTINNSNAQDDFTPDDIYEWTFNRFIKKRNSIAEVIMAVNGEKTPALIGLCEIENRFVLQHLTDSTRLKQHNYSILHNDSPDSRGIDVALLYKKDNLCLIDSAFLLMGNIEGNKDKREIVYAKFVLNKLDTLHLFAHHFPSKRGGVRKTAPLRMAAAMALKQFTDSILTVNPKANILIMGDFNDTYNSNTLKNGLFANNSFTDICDSTLYNISAPLAIAGEGSIKYRNKWQLVDMFLVSGNMLKRSSRLYCDADNVSIFKPDFLLEYVPASNNYRPKPTYRWIKYIGGYSDHLPILMTVRLTE